MPIPDHPQQSTDVASPEALLQMITGFWTSQAILAAAKLGITDLVKDGPKSCEALARKTGSEYIS